MLSKQKNKMNKHTEMQQYWIYDENSVVFFGIKMKIIENLNKNQNELEMWIDNTETHTQCWPKMNRINQK